MNCKSYENRSHPLRSEISNSHKRGFAAWHRLLTKSSIRFSIKDEVNDLHPLLKVMLPKLPRVHNVEYHHAAAIRTGSSKPRK